MTRPFGILCSVLFVFCVFTTHTASALGGFTNLLGIFATRQKRMSEVFQERCDDAVQQGLLHPSGRSWSAHEIQQHIQDEYNRRQGNLLQKWWRQLTNNNSSNKKE